MFHDLEYLSANNLLVPEMDFSTSFAIPEVPGKTSNSSLDECLRSLLRLDRCLGWQGRGFVPGLRHTCAPFSPLFSLVQDVFKGFINVYILQDGPPPLLSGPV